MRMLWRVIVEMFREGPSLYAEACDRSVLRYHAPFDLEGDGTGPAVCLPCKTEWPCDPFIAADRRIDDRINGGYVGAVPAGAGEPIRLTRGVALMPRAMINKYGDALRRLQPDTDLVAIEDIEDDEE